MSDDHKPPLRTLVQMIEGFTSAGVRPEDQIPALESMWIGLRGKLRIVGLGRVRTISPVDGCYKEC